MIDWFIYSLALAAFLGCLGLMLTRPSGAVDSTPPSQGEDESSILF